MLARLFCYKSRPTSFANAFSFCSKKQTLSKENLKQEYAKFWVFCKPELNKFVICGLLTALSTVFLYYISGNIYQDLEKLLKLKKGQQGMDHIIAKYGSETGKWVLIFALMSVGSLYRRYLLVDLANRITVRLRKVLFSRLIDKDFFRKVRVPQTYVHHIVTDTRVIGQFLAYSTLSAVRGVCLLVGGAGYLLYTAPYIFVLGMGVFGSMSLFFRKRNALLRKLKEVENKSLIALSEFTAERLQSLRLIKISDSDVLEQLRFQRELLKFYENSQQVSLKSSTNYAYLEGLGFLALFTIAVGGSFMMTMGLAQFSLLSSASITVFAAIGVNSLFSYNTELMKVSGIYKTIQTNIGQIHNSSFASSQFQIKEDEIEKAIEKLYETKYNMPRKGLSICIRGIKFAYKGEKGETLLLDNFSLNITQGETVALVGPSGTGKTTLFNLLTKIIEPDQGEIFLGETSIATMSFNDVQRNVSYVTQQNYLFRGTVAENIIYGNQGFDCSEQNMLECLRLTNALQFIQAKGGLRSSLSEKGLNLSGGERQRLILARALIKKPRLLLLDEATSGIDKESEKLIIANLKQHRKGTTTIIITHNIEPFKALLTQTISMEK